MTRDFNCNIKFCQLNDEGRCNSINGVSNTTILNCPLNHKKYKIKYK